MCDGEMDDARQRVVRVSLGDPFFVERKSNDARAASSRAVEPSFVFVSRKDDAAGNAKSDSGGVYVRQKYTSAWSELSSSSASTVDSCVTAGTTPPWCANPKKAAPSRLAADQAASATGEDARRAAAPSAAGRRRRRKQPEQEPRFLVRRQGEEHEGHDD